MKAGTQPRARRPLECGGRLAAMRDSGLDHTCQVQNVEGLGDVVEGVESGFPVTMTTGKSGYIPVHDRHVDVERDDVRWSDRHRHECLLAALRGDGVVALRLEGLRQRAENLGLVVNGENAGMARHGIARTVSRRADGGNTWAYSPAT